MNRNVADMYLLWGQQAAGSIPGTTARVRLLMGCGCHSQWVSERRHSSGRGRTETAVPVLWFPVPCDLCTRSLELLPWGGRLEWLNSVISIFLFCSLASSVGVEGHLSGHRKGCMELKKAPAPTMLALAGVSKPLAPPHDCGISKGGPASPNIPRASCLLLPFAQHNATWQNP